MLLSIAHRRRLVAAAAALLTGDRTGTAHRKPIGFRWAKHVDRLSEPEFKLRYRLSSDSFYNLRDLLQPEMQVSERHAAFARSGSPIEPETRLAAALRYFAGGNPNDLKLIYDLSTATLLS